MRCINRLFTFFGLFFIAAVLMATGAFADFQVNLLAIDADRNGIVNEKSIKKGLDYFLVKPNPEKLSSHQGIFHTASQGIYTSASWSDLQKPDALKALLVAKIIPEGIKTVTPANLGYNGVQIIVHPENQADFYLSTYRGNYDKVIAVPYQMILPRHQEIISR